MPFKPPLTLDQLHDIQERNKHNPDVYFLLWEIKRLQSIVLRADQLQRSIGTSGTISSGTAIVLSSLRGELEGEPVAVEDQARRDYLLSR